MRLFATPVSQGLRLGLLSTLFGLKTRAVRFSVGGKHFKALAKRTRKWMQVENLGLLATPFGQALRALALNCAHFGRDQICTQVDASFSTFGHQTLVNAS